MEKGTSSGNQYLPEQIILNQLSAIQWRMQINQLFQALASYGFWGLIVAGLLLIAHRLFPLPIPIGVAASLPIVAASVIAVGLVLLRKTDQRVVAHFVDCRLNLKERLSTALESIRRGRLDDFATLQIRDAARFAKEIVPATAVSYTLPSTLKWLPIPLLLIGLSFFIPRMYEIPPPPTAAERAAIDAAAARLEQRRRGLSDAALARHLRDTVDALRNKRIDVQAAQNKLSQLRDEIRARKSQLAENETNQALEAISKIGEESKLIRSADASQMASDLEKIADQMAGLTPDQQAELNALLKKLADRLKGNPAAKSLTDQLEEIETQGLSPEMLKRIARSLLAIDQQSKDIAQLEQILEGVKASRKNIGLAGIEMERKTGGVASSGGGPGEESDTREAQGAQVGAGDSGGAGFEPKGTTGEPETAIQTEGTSSQSLETQNGELRLKGIDSDSQNFSSATMQEEPTGGNEPAYQPYRKVYLNAKQAYAEAIKRDQIPVRYRRQMRDYMEAIANLSQREIKGK